MIITLFRLYDYVILYTYVFYLVILIGMPIHAVSAPLHHHHSNFYTKCDRYARSPRVVTLKVQAQMLSQVRASRNCSPC